MEASPPPPQTPPVQAGTAKRIEVGRVISETFDMYGKHAGALLGAAVVIFTISGVIQGFLRDEGGFVLLTLSSIVSIVAGVLYTGFVVNLVADVRRDGRRDMTAGQLVSATTPVILPLIGVGILAGIGIGIGLILLIVPGLILLTIWAVIAPAIVVERVGVFDSFGRSHQLVKGDAWSVFGAIVVAYLIVIGVGFIVAAIGASLSLVALTILLIVFGIVTAPIPALVSSILFFDLGGGQGAAPAQPAAPAAPVA
jgi:hypothetical protein